MSRDFRSLVDDVLGACTDSFGEEVTFYPTEENGGGVYEMRAIFDNAYQAVDPETEEIISANQSALGINLNDFQREGCPVNKNDKFKVRDIFYRVIDVQEDGQGGATVLVHKIREDDTVNFRKFRRSRG